MFAEHAEPQEIEHWPKTDQPLRIALLGWARLSLQQREGSGYNLNASELAAGLARSGHKALYVRSGMDYSVRPGIRIGFVERWRGVDCHHVVNSPNVAPASANFRNMACEIKSPEHSRLVVDFLRAQRVQVAHIHSMEGYGLDLITALRAAGLRVVVTPHNYWYACPQVDLLHAEREICFDYDGGRRCEGCLSARTPVFHRRLRKAEQSAQRRFGTFAVGLGWHAARAVQRRLHGMDPKDVPFSGDVAQTDPEAGAGFDVGDRRETVIEPGFDLREIEAPKVPGIAPMDANERMLANRDVHLRVLKGNIYARRRLAGIAALNAADAVTPPSAFVLKTYEAMGLDPSRGGVVRLGQPHFDVIHRRTRRGPHYATRSWYARTATRPLRLAFLGTVRPNKGLEVFASAIERMPAGVRAGCHFIVRAFGNDWAFRKRLSRFPEVSFAGGFEPWAIASIAGEYDVGVLPHVWFENSPLVLLEHLHAGKMVIASRLGGPVEWAVEAGDGRAGNMLMCEGGDPDSLASAIGRVVSGEVPVPSGAEVHAMTPHLCDYPSHVANVETVYRSVLAGEGVPEAFTTNDTTKNPQPALGAR
ncbi:MAG: glycosyltransferase [Phycisphaerales bacterium]|nr:MAG: glycosyltransferase [Phycisphaerales bacterium]